MSSYKIALNFEDGVTRFIECKAQILFDDLQIDQRLATRRHANLRLFRMSSQRMAETLLDHAHQAVVMPRV